MVRRRSNVYFLFIFFLLALLVACAGHAFYGGTTAAGEQAVRRSLVKQLALTDLVLATDARYTRHPAMADRHAPFQDHPLAFDHFPSGSLLTAPLTGKKP